MNTRAIICGILFVSSDPLSEDELAKISSLPPKKINSALHDLRKVLADECLGLDIVHLDGRWQLCTRPELAPYVEKVFPQSRRGLSHAALETLSIIAYKQPITRAEIERIRGVNVEGVLQTLLEKDLIREKGRRTGPGRPVLFGTTDEFLRYFNLASLEELPEISTLSRD